MANLQNFRDNQRPDWLTGLGQKVKNAAEFVGAVKGMYEVGRTVYSGFAVAAPYIEAVMLAGL